MQPEGPQGSSVSALRRKEEQLDVLLAFFHVDVQQGTSDILRLQLNRQTLFHWKNVLNQETSLHCLSRPKFHRLLALPDNEGREGRAWGC